MRGSIMDRVRNLMRRASATAWVCLCAASLGLTGCYDAKAVNLFLQKPRMPVAATEYRIYPPDEILITSLHVAEIHNILQRVRPDGKINLPLLGELDVAGRTPREIEDLITQSASEYYSKVAATVEVRTYASQRFYVFGQVDMPGPLPWTGRDTLLDALAKTQPNELSWPERIIVVRGDDPKAAGYAWEEPAEPGSYSISGVRPERKDRPRKKMVVNMMAMLESGDMSNNILLMPDDVIYVQPNPLARLGLAIQSILFPLRGAGDALATYRYAVDDARWIGDGQPRDNLRSRTVTVR